MYQHDYRMSMQSYLKRSIRGHVETTKAMIEKRSIKVVCNDRNITHREILALKRLDRYLRFHNKGKIVYKNPNSILKCVFKACGV